ncbi:hypothetical protein OAU91_02185 [Flavobacteriaceae bacterium]|nr:hypothetical protein [Flavobacteriaceae bacterium]
MKRILILTAILVFACSTDSEGNPCIYEPTLTTEVVTDITETSATLNGVISIVSENCDVPNNTEQGFVYSTEIQPTLEDTQVNVNGTNISTTIEGLTPNTTYYVRAFLTNNLGDFYGDEVSFTTEETLGCGSQTDYLSIVYGTQEWTVENACHTTYRDGTPIPQVTDATEWLNLTKGAWCYYDNDPTKHILYNWYAVMGIHDTDPNTPNKEFTAEGWRLPSEGDWEFLGQYLIENGFNFDGTYEGNKVAKSMASNTGWDFSSIPGRPGNNQEINNSSGFNAHPKGYLSADPNYLFLLNGNGTLFWSSSSYNSDYAKSIYIGNISETLPGGGTNLKINGFSVRLIKD